MKKNHPQAIHDECFFIELDFDKFTISNLNDGLVFNISTNVSMKKKPILDGLRVRNKM